MLLRVLDLGRQAVRWYPGVAPGSLRRRFEALAADAAALGAEAEVLEAALFAMPGRGREGCVPDLFLDGAAEGREVVDLTS